MRRMMPKAKPQSTFGTKLKELREAKGLTRYALAKLAGTSPIHVDGLEKDERQPSWEMVQRIAAALGASTEDFR
jgi:transcriptional regulator with XRE-family HTH domain